MVVTPRRHEAGFTYVGLVVFVAILGMVGAATLKVDGLLRRAAAEQELLEIGAAYSEALRSYAAATPRGLPALAPTLQDLLKDPRFPGARRHLRKMFVDPITGSTEWGVLYQGDRVGVLAVYSLSRTQPLKQANFDARFQNFDNKKHLSEWKFTAAGLAAVPGPAPPAPALETPGLPPGAPARPPPPQAPPDEAQEAPQAEPDEPDELIEPEAAPVAATEQTVSGG